MNSTLSELDYTFTLKGKDIISLRLSGMGCGAYCSSWNLYFNFDLLTGDLIKIEEVISKSELEGFRNMVLKDELKALQQHKNELESYLTDKNPDAEDIKLAKDYIDENCDDQVNIKIFSLSPDGLEIIDDCEFPHFMRNLQPVYHLKYSYKQLDRVTNPDFTKKLKEVMLIRGFLRLIPHFYFIKKAGKLFTGFLILLFKSIRWRIVAMVGIETSRYHTCCSSDRCI